MSDHLEGCPKCGSDADNITHDNLRPGDNGIVYQDGSCNDCNAMWVVYYNCGGYNITDNGDIDYATQFKKLHTDVVEVAMKFSQRDPGIIKFIGSVATVLNEYNTHANPDHAIEKLIDVIAKGRGCTEGVSTKTHVKNAKIFNLQRATSMSLLKEYYDDANWHTEPAMGDMHVADAADHFTLAFAILSGHHRDIVKATSLDTASRECITDEVWEWLEEEEYT